MISTEPPPTPARTLPELLRAVTPLDEYRCALLKATYMNLGFALGAAFLGAHLGVDMPGLTRLFAEWYGVLLALVVLNVLPAIAYSFRRHPSLGFSGLILSGFISGLVLGPTIYALSRSYLGQNLLSQALLITLFLFVAVTYMVFFLGQRYSAPQLLMNSLAVATFGAIILGLFSAHSLLQVLITMLIGTLGVLGLVSGTSEILYDETIDEPISGALTLFAAIFNIFVALVRVLVALHED